MEKFLIEIKGKFYYESAAEPDNVPGDIYSRIAEIFKSDEDSIDIEIQTYILPKDGASD